MPKPLQEELSVEMRTQYAELLSVERERAEAEALHLEAASVEQEAAADVEAAWGHCDVVREAAGALQAQRDRLAAQFMVLREEEDEACAREAEVRDELSLACEIKVAAEQRVARSERAAEERVAHAENVAAESRIAAEAQCEDIGRRIQQAVDRRKAIRVHLDHAVGAMAQGTRDPEGCWGEECGSCGWLPRGCLCAWAVHVKAQREAETALRLEREASFRGSTISRARGAALSQLQLRLQTRLEEQQLRQKPEPGAEEAPPVLRAYLPESPPCAPPGGRINPSAN